MSLKPELRKTLLETYSKEGMPPIIDKTVGSIWEAFAKTQPNALTTSSLPPGTDTDFWGNLDKALSKFGVMDTIAKKTITTLKKKFGEKPSLPDIKAMMS